MRLEEIQIKNFRSIKNLNLDISLLNNSYARVILGLNGCGKSNLLKAIASLKKDFKIDYEEDCEKTAKINQEQIMISYIFSPNEKEKKSLILNFSDKIKLNDFFKKNSIEKIKYNISIGKDNQKISKVFIEIASSEDLEIEGVIIELLGRELNEEEKSRKKDTLGWLIGNKISAKIEPLLPQVIYWKFDDNYLISKPINLEDFKNNINNYPPLLNIFLMSGIKKENIPSVIELIKKSSLERYDLTEKLSIAATKHINEIWKEHKIKIEINLDTDNTCNVAVIDSGLEENKRFSMQQRSDGFKRFANFLFGLSAPRKSNTLENSLILIDEPENSLHPSAIEFLRNELLEISKKNYLFVSSHSIFIFDHNCPQRHIILEKKGLYTDVKSGEAFEEEKLLNALGTSLYKILKEKYILFEGEIDSIAFQILASRFEFYNTNKIEVLGLDGASNITKNIRLLKSKKIIIFTIFDSDFSGRCELKRIRESGFLNYSFELKDILDIGKSLFTFEDLLPQKLIISCASEIYKIQINEENIDKSKMILDEIKKIKNISKINNDPDLKNLKSLIISKVLRDFRDLSEDEIRNKYNFYYRFAKTLSNKIKSKN